MDDSAVSGDSGALYYNSSSVDVYPIVEGTLNTDAADSVPTQVQAQLTWNGGTPQSWATWTVPGGHSAGDSYVFGVQSTSQVTTTGVYPYTLTVRTVLSNGSVLQWVADGTAAIWVDGSGPFGPGWTLDSYDTLTPVSGGVIDTNGHGWVRYFQTNPAGGNTYLSPANDQGTLAIATYMFSGQAKATYTYTAVDQTKHVFGEPPFVNAVELDAITDPRGLSVTFTYSGSGTTLSGLKEPDGGLVTFSYGTGGITKIQEPGGYSVTLTYSPAGDLQTLQNPDGGLRTLAYNTVHQVTNDQFGPLNGTVTYSSSNKELSKIDLGLGSTLTFAPANTAALAALISPGQDVGTTTDAYGYTTSYVLDGLGRLTGLQTPDGGSQSWVLDAAGNPVVYTDPLGHVTRYTRDASEMVTSIVYADNALDQYTYSSNFHEVLTYTDPLGNTTTNTYSSTADLLTVTDALNHTTTYSWSGGLLQTVTDPANHVTTYQWDTTKRRLLDTIDPLGNVNTFTYDQPGDQATALDPLNHLSSAVYDKMRRPLTQTDALGQSSTATYNAIGQPISQTDALGETVQPHYDQRGLATSVVEGVGSTLQRTTTTVYDLDLRVLSVTDPLGHTTSYAYSPVGDVTETIQAYGTSLAQTSTVAYDLARNVLSSTDALGVTTSFGYDARNRETEVLTAYGYPEQQTTLSGYDLAGNTLYTEDARGTITSFAYDPDERQIATIEAFGTSLQRTSTVAYDVVGNVLYQLDPRGTMTSFGYDADNRQITEIDDFGTGHLNRTLTTVYDKASNVLSQGDGLGHLVSYAYDADNRVSQTLAGYGLPEQISTSVAYNAIGDVLSQTDARGTTTSFGYDALHRQNAVIEAYGTSLQRTTTTAYDLGDNTLSITNPNGTVTSFALDALNRQVNEIAGYGTSLAETSTLLYDAMDNVTVRIDPAGNRTTMSYDHLYREITSKDPGGGVQTLAYDGDNNVSAVTDANGNTTSYGFDVLNRNVTITAPLLAGQSHPGVTTMAFDANDNMIALTDADANTTTFTFDALNRESQMKDPLNASATYAYDAADRLTSQTDRDGRVKNFTYDGLDRELTETWIQGGSTVNVLTFMYDANSNVTLALDYHGTYTLAYDALDRLSNENEPFSLSLTLGYDANDNRTLVQDSFGGTLTSVYDALDRLTSRQFGGTGQTPLRFDLAYNSRNNVTQVTRFSNLAGTATVGYTSYSYDTADRVTNIKHENGSKAVLANLTYTYDLGSRLKTEKSSGVTRTFTYDTNNELTNDGTNAYTYDLNGNRTMTGYTTGAANELTSDGAWTMTYDGEGNQISRRNISTGETWTDGYDLDNRLITAKDISGTGTTLTLATYTYDVFGNRIESDVWTQSGGTTTVTRFGYDGDQVWADLASNNSLSMRYLRGDEEDQLFARISGAGVASWYLTDWEGSVRKLTDNTGKLIDTITYDGFGDIGTESNATQGGAYKFDGMRYDAETSDYSTWGRSETPANGRWLQRDPAGLATAAANLYDFAGSDPVNLNDPAGLQSKPIQLTIGSSYKPEMGTNGAFAWPIRWELTRKSASGGMILQHVRIWYHVRKVAGTGQAIPILPWLDSPYLTGQNPGSEIAQQNQKGREPQLPYAPNVDYWEAWRVPPDSVHSSEDSVLSSQSKLPLVRQLITNFGEDGVTTLEGRTASDWFFLPSGRHTGSKYRRTCNGIRYGGPRDDTQGWILFYGEAYYFDTMGINDLTAGGSFFTHQQHLTTGAGGLLSFPTGTKGNQNTMLRFLARWASHQSNKVTHEIRVHWGTGLGTDTTHLDWAKINGHRIE